MQVTDEMVRVAAEAAYNKFNENLIGCCEPAWDGLSDDVKLRMQDSVRAALTVALAAMWRPISEAPKDGSNVLVNDTRYPNRTVFIARWNDCRYHTKAKGYWAFTDERVHGVALSRANQPTHFMPLPQPPAQKEVE